ncbi:MAG: DMT family transporter [Hyphomicrobiales bacterium]|nr:DMT family transporter [Hyphomicrobiales bacterium]
MTLLRNPHLLLMLTAIFWSGNAIAGKFAVGHVSPMMLTMARWALALAIMVAIAQEPLRRDWPTLRKHWVYLLLMGGFGYTAFNFFLYSALKHISAINVTLEQSAMPLVIFVLNYLIYRTGITWLQIFGFIVTTLGVVVIVSSGDPYGLLFADGGLSGLNIGDLFMLGAAICYGGYSAALRSKPQMHWMSFLTGLIAGALVFAIGGAVFEYQTGQLQVPQTAQGMLVILYAGIFPSLLSQGFFIKGVEAFGANVAGLYINLVPIFGAILAVVLLGEQLYLFHALAFLLVVGGIMIAQHKPAAARSQSES